MGRGLTGGSVVDDEVEPAADAHAVGVDQPHAEQRGDGRIHRRAVPLQDVSGNTTDTSRL